MRPAARTLALACSVIAALYLAAVALGAVPALKTYGFGYGYNGYGGPDQCEERDADGTCVDQGPSSTNYSPGQPGPSFAGGAGYNAFLTIPAGAFDFPATVTLDPEPPAKGPAPPTESGFSFSPLGEIHEITVRNRANGAIERGGDWDPPLRLSITYVNYDGPDSELLVAYYETGVPNPGWRTIPFMGRVANDAPDPQLAVGARDGFFTRDNGFRVVTILTRHTTPFATFVRTATGTTDTGGGNTGGGDTVTPPAQPNPPARPAAVPAPRTSRLTAAPSRLVARRNRVVVPCRATAPATRCRVRLTARSGRRTRTIGQATAPLRAGRASVTVRLNAVGRRVARRATRRRAVSVGVRLEALGGTRVLATTSRSARLTRR